MIDPVSWQNSHMDNETSLAYIFHVALIDYSILHFLPVKGCNTVELLIMAPISYQRGGWRLVQGDVNDAPKFCQVLGCL